MINETVFNMASSNIRYGPGATQEIGMDLVDIGVEHVMVVTDQNLAKLDCVYAAMEVLDKQNIRYTLFDKARVEPTDTSLKEAIDFASAQSFDAFVAIGGGSTIDTAKAANLYSTYPADFLDYVNTPIGRGKPKHAQCAHCCDSFTPGSKSGISDFGNVANVFTKYDEEFI